MNSSVVSGTAASAAKVVPPNRSRTSGTHLQVTGLKVDHREQFLGLGNPLPRLSWRLESCDRNVQQNAYRILVASSKEALHHDRGDLWDSGEIHSRQSFDIEYGGVPLTSRQRCWWAVEVWDTRGNRARSNGDDWWEMGLLSPDDWSAAWLTVEDRVAREDRNTGLKWIWGHAPAEQSRHGFRFSFDLPDATLSGELVIALKQSFWWNQITRIWLDDVAITGPGKWIAVFPAPFDTSLGTAASDLTSRRLPLGVLQPGRHVLAIEIGTRPISSWSSAYFATPGTAPSAPALASLCRFELANGRTLRFTTGSDWTTHSEDLVDGWQQLNFDDSHWSRAIPNLDDPHQPWPAQPAMLLRRGFSLAGRITRARLYVTALGAYEARLNGVRVGNAVLAPGPSQYDKRVMYQVFDVESLLRAGNNVLGLIVADGWYAGFDGRFAWSDPPRRVIAQLELTYDNGTHEVIATERGWRIAESAIRSSQIKIGEVHDNRLDSPGWELAEFDDSQWQNAQIAERPACVLSAEACPPIQVKNRLKPLAITTTANNDYIIDFGTCFVGWCELLVSGSKGAKIELRYSELLDSSGDIDQSRMYEDPTGGSRVDVFFLNGDQAGEHLAARFVYRGFRYVKVSGLSSPLHPDAVDGIFIYSDLEETGAIRSENAIVRGIFKLALQSQRSNFVGVPVDNGTREVRGYMGEMGVYGEAASYLMDVSTFFANHVQIAVDGQSEDGVFQLYAPCPRHAVLFPQPPGDAPGWGLGVIFMIWQCWHQYGDTAVVARNWEAMNRYMQFILANNPSYLWLHKRGFDFGDWLSLESTPKELFATALWAQAATLLAEMAQVMEKPDEAKRLASLRTRIQEAFTSAFVKTDGTIGNGSQASYVLSLAFDLIAKEVRPRALARLADTIRKRSPVGLSTGTWGTRYILDVLTDGGYGDLAYELLTSTSFPSWGYMLRNDATAIWESWDGKNGNRNQPALGSVAGYLFRRVAGITAAAPGFTSIVIRPRFSRYVNQGGGDYNSVMGRISTDWLRSAAGDIRLEVTVPANTTAHVHLPAHQTSRILEGDREIDNSRGIILLRRTDDEAVIVIGSGNYQFLVAG